MRGKEMSDPVSPSKKHDFKTSILQGLSAAWPICLGYIPIGMAFGVLAQKAGLYPLEIMMMSIFVFAGSSQFIAFLPAAHSLLPYPCFQPVGGLFRLLLQHLQSI